MRCSPHVLWLGRLKRLAGVCWRRLHLGVREATLSGSEVGTMEREDGLPELPSDLKGDTRSYYTMPNSHPLARMIVRTRPPFSLCPGPLRSPFDGLSCVQNARPCTPSTSAGSKVQQECPHQHLSNKSEYIVLHWGSDTFPCQLIRAAPFSRRHNTECWIESDQCLGSDSTCLADAFGPCCPTNTRRRGWEGTCNWARQSRCPLSPMRWLHPRRFVRASLTYIPGCVHGLTLGHVACAVSSHEVKRPVIPLPAENKLAYTPLIFRHMQERYPLCHPKKAYAFRTRQPEQSACSDGTLSSISARSPTRQQQTLVA
jgi:hypothetical protein